MSIEGCEGESEGKVIGKKGHVMPHFLLPSHEVIRSRGIAQKPYVLDLNLESTLSRIFVYLHLLLPSSSARWLHCTLHEKREKVYCN